MSERPLTVAAVEAALADFKDPETGRAALQLGQLRDIQVSGNTAKAEFA